MVWNINNSEASLRYKMNLKYLSLLYFHHWQCCSACKSPCWTFVVCAAWFAQECALSSKFLLFNFKLIVF